MIDPLSFIPLHVETYYNNKELYNSTDTKIADATAFVYRKGWDRYLITNWHVVSGRHPLTGKPLSKTGAIPNVIKVSFPNDDATAWLQSSFELLDWKTDEKKWKEHPRGKGIDVIALPLPEILIVEPHPLEEVLFNTSLEILPSEPVSVIGYPYGMPSVGGLPIWKTGHVASDIDGDYDGKPVFLVDGTFREGMSGAPVIARRKEMISADKTILITLDNMDRFLGVFSGGISKKYDSEIGMVWKPEVINEIIEGKDELMKKIIKYKRLNQ